MMTRRETRKLAIDMRPAIFEAPRYCGVPWHDWMRLAIQQTSIYIAWMRLFIRLYVIYFFDLSNMAHIDSATMFVQAQA